MAFMCLLPARLLRDYEKQRKAGLDPGFRPEDFGITKGAEIRRTINTSTS
jgi:hypothetical protein